MKIKYVNWGIGNNFGEYIELNKNLKKYPKLHNSILKHELKHTNNIFSKKDLLLDFGESEINNFEMIKFMLNHPRSFSQFLPIYPKRGVGIVYDINLIILYIFITTLLSVTFYLSTIV